MRHPVRWLDEITGDGPVYALLVLFGLNAVDELDRSAFGILLPEIRDHFGLGLQGVLTLIAVVSLAALLLQVPIGALADRRNRVVIAAVGAAMWGIFSLLTGLAVSVVMLAIVRTGSGLGKATVDPTHNSLIADYFEPAVRPRAFSFHRSANAVGAFVGPLAAGLLAYSFGWRAPFIVFAVPTMILVFLALRMKEPIRGAQERRAMGAEEDVINTEEVAPSFAEGWRMVWKIETLRRIWYALPFLAASVIGFVSLAALFYEQEFNLDERARGFVAASVEPVQLIGLIIGARIGTRLMVRDPSLIMKFLSRVALLVSACLVIFALAPNIGVAIVANAIITGALAMLTPGIFASLSLAIPPRARSIGYSVSSLWIIPGLVILPIIGAVGDKWSIRWGMVIMVPIFLIGGLVIASASKSMNRDITQVWSAAAARSEALYERRQGRSKLLIARNLEVGYGNVQVLFGVDFEVEEGQIIALLGTNGAGKSTLLRAFSGQVEADSGAVIFDGRDITHAPPNEIAAMGIVQMPGGNGVFGDLTVRENLRVAGWLHRHDQEAVAESVERVLSMFPVLRHRLDDPSADLSGGQQQMLALGMAFLSKPRLLMIDELSLGLAPVIVEQLLPIVRQIAADGTTIILVEQSVNVALTVAETAFFMEKGQIRFHGPTAELLERPDVLRSVFLEGASAGAESGATPDGAVPVPARVADFVLGSDVIEAARAAADADSSVGRGPVSPEAAADADDRLLDVAAASVVAEAQAQEAAADEPAVDASADGAHAEAAAVAPAPTGPALAAWELRRRFGGITAVDKVTLSVAPGEILGIIGPNGAGKTTLFDLISGFTPADGGRLELSGVDITHLPAHRRAIHGLGRSFQDARLFPALTVEETLAVSLERWVEVRDPLSAALHLPGVFDSEEKTSKRVNELMDLLGLGSFRSKLMRELSTGSRRVVDLACVVAHRPTVVLLDEPSSGIAQRETEALVPLLLRIREQLGAAILVIEHDMPLVTAVSDRLIAMDQGAIIADGASDHVLHDPLVVSSYLGTTDEVITRSGRLPVATPR